MLCVGWTDNSEENFQKNLILKGPQGPNVTQSPICAVERRNSIGKLLSEGEIALSEHVIIK